MLWEGNSFNLTISTYQQGVVERAKQAGISEENLALIIESVERVEKNLPSLQTDEEKNRVAELYSMKRFSDQYADAYKQNNENLTAVLQNWPKTYDVNSSSQFSEMRKALEAKDKVISDLQTALLLKQTASLN